MTAPPPTAGSRNAWPTPASGTRRSAREAVAAPGHASRLSGPEGASALLLARRNSLSQIRHNKPGRNAPCHLSPDSQTATTLAQPLLTRPVSTAHRPPSTSSRILSTIPRTASNSGALSTAASCAATAPSRFPTTSPSPCEKPSPTSPSTASLPFPNYPSPGHRRVAPPLPIPTPNSRLFPGRLQRYFHGHPPDLDQTRGHHPGTGPPPLFAPPPARQSLASSTSTRFPAAARSRSSRAPQATHDTCVRSSSVSRLPHRTHCRDVYAAGTPATIQSPLRTEISSRAFRNIPGAPFFRLRFMPRLPRPLGKRDNLLRRRKRTRKTRRKAVRQGAECHPAVSAVPAGNPRPDWRLASVGPVPPQPATSIAAQTAPRRTCIPPRLPANGLVGGQTGLETELQKPSTARRMVLARADPLLETRTPDDAVPCTETRRQLQPYTQSASPDAACLEIAWLEIACLEKKPRDRTGLIPVHYNP